jgi:hypothetical protein
VHRDTARGAVAGHFARSDIPRAWQAASKVGDLDRRIEAAKKVYEVWAGRDREEADRAWYRLFPPGQ